MSSLLYALGRWAFRSWKIIVAAWIAIAITIIALGFLLFGGLSTAFNLPGTEAQAGIDYLTERFPELKGGQGIMLQVAKPGHKVTDPDLVQQRQEMVQKLYKIKDMSVVLPPGKSHVSAGDVEVFGNINKDASAAMIQLQMTVPTTEVTPAVQHSITKLATASSNDENTWYGGGTIFSPPQPTIKPTEVIGIAVAAVVLSIAFRSVIAATIPMVGAVFGGILTIFGIVIMTHWLTISPTAPLVAIMIGLAVGIDYALFLVSRHRQQLQDGYTPEESAGLALATAGSAVVFAGLTVVIALLGLIVANIPFIMMMGLCGALGVVVSVCITMTLMPALMGLLGDRLIPKKSIAKRGKYKGQVKPDRSGKGGAAYVKLITKAPWLTVALVIPPLLLLMSPALGLKLALPDGSEAEHDAPSLETYHKVADTMGPGWNTPIIVTADIVTSYDPFKLIDYLKGVLEKVPGVSLVSIATPNPPNGDTLVVQLYTAGNANSPATLSVVHTLRKERALIAKQTDSSTVPFGCKGGCQIIVTGYAAAAIDISARVNSGLLPFVILVFGMSLILLAMVMRSVFVPIKATVGFALSVGCGFGGVKLIYNDGWFEKVVQTVHVGPIVSFGPIIILACMFGLAMDYEVFLVSRMREDYVHHGEAKGAITRGFTASARVVVAAAFIMVVVFVAFVPESDANVQPIACGLAIGVFIDAFIVRMTLVPAVMAIAGDKAWWIPEKLDRVLPVFDVEGEGIYHQLALADFPYPNAPEGVYAENLDVSDRGKVVYTGINLSINPGEVLLISGSTASTRKGLLMTVAGRLRPTEGKLKVGGFVLPQQCLVARGKYAFVRIDEETDVVRAMRKAIHRNTKVILIDGLDLIPSEADRQYILDLFDRLCAERNIPGLIATSPESLDYLHVPDHFQWLHLDDSDLSGDFVDATLHRPSSDGVETIPATELESRILEETR